MMNNVRVRKILMSGLGYLFTILQCMYHLFFLFNLTMYRTFHRNRESAFEEILRKKRRKKGKKRVEKQKKGMVEQSKYETNTKSMYARIQNTVTYKQIQIIFVNCFKEKKGKFSSP